MNLIEALNKQRNLRRPIAKHMGSHKDGWLDWRYVEGIVMGGLTSLITEDDFHADDWEVQDPKLKAWILHGGTIALTSDGEIHSSTWRRAPWLDEP